MRLSIEAWPDKSRPTVFLDRDGVLMADMSYVSRVEDVHLIPGAAAACVALSAAGCRLVVVSNQSGVGRGHFDWPTLHAVEDRLMYLLAEQGATLDAVIANSAAPGSAGQAFRKPNVGMLELALKLLPSDPKDCWIVGDRLSDIEAGRKMNLKGGVLLSADEPASPWGRAIKTADWSVAVAHILKRAHE